MKAACLCIFLIFCCSKQVPAQTRVIDSLEKRLAAATNQQQRLMDLLDLCEQFQSLERDKLDQYAVEAKFLSARSEDRDIKNLAAIAFANSYLRWGWTDSALAVLDATLKNTSLANARARAVRFKALRQKAFCYGGISMYPEALNTLFLLLKEAEQYDDSVIVCSTINSIGSVAIARSETDEAMKWIREAKSRAGNTPRFVPVLASVYVNLAYAFLIKGNPDSASFYIRKGLPMARSAENLHILATALRIKSSIASYQQDYKSAEKALLEMLEVRKKTDGASIVAEDNLLLARFYANSGQIEKAIKVCLDHLDTGSRYGNDGEIHAHTSSIPVRLLYYQALAEFYRAAGNSADYEQILENIIAAKDTLYKMNSAEALADAEVKYELQKKETLIARQKLTLTKRNYFIAAAATILIILTIAGIVVFRNYRKRQRLIMDFALREEKQQAVRAVQQAEENERRRIAADLHDNLGAQFNALLYGTGELRQHPLASTMADNLHFIASDMLQSLRETIWALKQPEISAMQLWIRVISFIKRVALVYEDISIICNGVVPEKLVLPSAAALNMVFIVQEAVNNALRHSGAKDITVVSRVENGIWIIIIADNGNGFDYALEALKQEGSGLLNMKQRAEMAEVNLMVESETGSGTSVRLAMPAIQVANTNPKEVLTEDKNAASFTT